MAMYNKILLAVDFNADNAEIISKAKEITEINGAQLHIVHVNEPLAAAYAADGLSWSEQVVNLEAEIRNEAKTRMSKLGNDLGVPAERCFLREGRASSEVHDVVNEHGIDLVVMGTHGQHGLGLLLGSTANSVLHGSTCDMLCVRVGDD